MNRVHRMSALRGRAALAVLLGVLCGGFAVPAARGAPAAGFSEGAGPAARFGVHEIALTGNGGVANPFDTDVTVTFTPAVGRSAQTVHAFFDGGDTWRARVYVGGTGRWLWTSRCASDPALDGRGGAFEAADSALCGRLLPHPANPRQWMTEDGRWFLNVSDTAYFLLCTHDGDGAPVAERDAQDYVSEAVGLGVTSVRCFLAGDAHGFRERREQWTDWIFEDEGATRLRFDNLQCADRRLRWLLDNRPGLAVQLILFPVADRSRDEGFWTGLSAAQRERALRQLVARYAAYPQLFWLIANDVHYGEKFPNNNAFAREVGRYLERNDPWQHPRSTGPARREVFPFGGETWASYIHLENEHDLGAAECARYRDCAKPVFLGEDRYEQDHGTDRDPAHMAYWQRRLYWAWLFSGGSATYGGRWWLLQPYTQTGKRAAPSRWNRDLVFRDALTGLDAARHIRSYFAARHIELSGFEADPGLAKDADGAAGARAPACMRRARQEFLIYHPNAAADGREARVDAARTPGLTVDLAAADGAFAAEWCRVRDGAAQAGGTVAGGRTQTLRSPWLGEDCVLRLLAE